MPFTGNENHSITLQDAAAMTKKYRDTVGTTFLAGYFGKTAISNIINQAACVGIRIYNARKTTGEFNFVLVGVKSDGEELYDDQLAEQTWACPPYCPNASPLNGTT
jgi:hypothetical protein